MKARTPRPALRYALHSVLRSVLYSVPRPALSARRITAAASLASGSADGPARELLVFVC